MVDTIGAHRGMHYFVFPLVEALVSENADMTLVSNDVTIRSDRRPRGIATLEAFRNIYGGSHKWQRGINYLLGLMRLTRHAFVVRPEVIHFHFNQIPQLDRMFFPLWRWLGAQVVISVHDILPFARSTESRAREAVYRRLYRGADKLITHSEFARSCLIELAPELVDRCHVVTQGNYLDFANENRMGRGAARTQLDLPATAPVILVFGTIKPNKRLDIALGALAQLATRYPDLRLVIAGVAKDVSLMALKTEIIEAGLADHVIWRDRFIPDQDVAAYYQAADIVLLPYDWIYQSATLVMAQSFGAAVVATDVGSNGEYVKHRQNGLLVSLEVSSIADAISLLLKETDLRRQIENEARNSMLELDWLRIAQDCLQIYATESPRL